MSAWARAAEDVDDLDLAATLWSQVDDEHAVSGRARVALLSGDAAGALALLAAAGVADVPADGPRSLDQLVVLGCRAAQGRPDDLSRLVAAGATLPAQLRLLYLYVLGAAAEGAGRQDLADGVWRTVVVEHGVRTPHVLSRFLASWVQGRPGTDGRAVVTRVAEAAHELVGAVPRPWEDAAALEATTRELVARGDAAGAALLTTTVSRLGPRSEAVDALVSAHAPRRRTLQRAVPVAVLVVAVVVSAVVLRHGLPGFAIGGAALWASRRWWAPVRGWSLADGQAWDGLVALRFDDTSGAPRERTSSLRLLPSLAAVAGLAVGVALGGWWWQWSLDPARHVPWQVSGIVGGLCWFGIPALATWAGVRGDRERRRRADVRRRTEADATALAQAATCRCWEASALVGSYAERYAAAHLGAAAGAAPVSVRAASVRVCPLSGMRWMATTSVTGASVVLLRGPAPSVPAPAPAVPGAGGYL
ncbi:hypothetical protein [Cellulomonas phragmiteti]|uniref:hypothetical protein n=1 Tax=Cellulomonas phragmiteti TaxID=478780 RepID=UPI001940A28F|nr:hypothetical protein [Cellulomonas phragmiteti]